MSSSAYSVLLLLLTAAFAVLATAPDSEAEAGELAASKYRGHHHVRRRGVHRPHTPPPAPTPGPPPPSPPGPLPFCDCRCNCTHCRVFPAEGRGSRAAAPPAIVRPRPGAFPWPRTGSGGSPPSSPTECVTPLAGLMTCGSFLTGSEQDTPTPQSECCSGLGAFLNTTGAAGDGDRTLRCLCPVILGDVNKMLPKPVDPVRMMYLPIACGVVLPPQLLSICIAGHQTPPLVWEKSSSAGTSEYSNSSSALSP